MKSTCRNSTPPLKRIAFKIFYSQISKKDIQLIQNALANTYGDILDIIIGEELELPIEAYNLQRNQYNGDKLISYLQKTKKTDTALWIIQKDLYCRGINFIFGYAKYHEAAVLSIYRLSNNELIEKEAIHEVGHILSLQHCSNHCVMHFSNSLWEAKMKPLYLCKSCKRKIISLLDN
jgi:archaemetzincin